MMKVTISPAPVQYMDTHRPTCCYHRIVQDVAGNQRSIGVGVLVLVAVLVPGLLTAGCYYASPSFTPLKSSDGLDAGADSDPGGNGAGSGPGTAGSDADGCFGTAPFRVCLAAAPTQPLNVSQLRTIDTTDLSKCAATVPASSQTCVMAATTITVEATLRATGSRPLVLIASDTITIKGSGVIDVGSHRNATPEVGAGADFKDCASGQPPIHGGGGAGGSFLGLGGMGGSGFNGSDKGGTPGPVAQTIPQLRGGCAGQDTPGFQRPTRGGHGGGAVLLIAGQSISVIGSGVINAAGEGGEGGSTGGGGGGGGAGGMIVLDAPTVTSSGLILASGAGGGGGSSDGSPGGPGGTGADPSDVFPPAVGGGGAVANGQPNGGRGGDGSTQRASSGGTDGGAGGATLTAGYGGGGGGGAGIVQAPAAADLGLRASPEKTTP